MRLTQLIYVVTIFPSPKISFSFFNRAQQRPVGYLIFFDTREIENQGKPLKLGNTI